MSSANSQAEKERSNAIALDLAEVTRRKRAGSRAKLAHEFILSGAWQCCLNCVEWETDGTHYFQCRKYKVPPPPEVLVAGCEEWFDVNAIPF